MPATLNMPTDFKKSFLDMLIIGNLIELIFQIDLICNHNHLESI
jgi:hypothetical protein